MSTKMTTKTITNQKFNFWKKMNFLLPVALLFSLGLALALVLPARSAALATYTVNSANDVNDGTCNGTHCSLREAINAANTNAGADTIVFNITSGCSGGICTIQPANNLPALSGGGTTIDGSTSANQIELDGSLIISNGFGLQITSADNVIRGLTINRFSSAGIEINGSAAQDNAIQGNKIGTDPGGTIDRGNGVGVRITGSARDNTVGGDTTAVRNLISGNNVGVEINDASYNTVSGNYIGVDVTGALALGNTYEGVLIDNAYGNQIGGDTTSQRNVISANEVGVGISGASAYQNVVGANYIGPAADGSGDLGNALYGVVLEDGADQNTIGGAVGSPRNVIAGNGNHGVLIAGDGTDDNDVMGNFIGLNASGSAALANGGNGVNIRFLAAYNTIGGDTSQERNVISGNTMNGVQIYLDSEFNTVSGNYIGLNWNATAGLGNGQNGILINEGSHDNIIGGDHDLGLGNVISRNAQNGVLISGDGTDNNVVKGNYIGLDPTGELWFGNQLSGVKIEAEAVNNTIGGAQVDGNGNAISCNQAYGVHITGSYTAQNKLRGNMIGLTADGSGGQGNALHGVFIEDSPDNVIGGADSYRNWITDNGGSGVVIGGANASGNLVAGNYIGLFFSGSAAIGNDENGVLINNGAHDNTIGTEANDGYNIISGNGWSGVQIHGSSTQNNTVAANRIGTDNTGDLDRGNGAQGVLIYQAQNNTIGGDTEGERNQISGNGLNGVHLNGAVGNTVSGNYIGVKSSGGSSLANDANGVSISGGATGNVIGGDVEGERNIISGNSGDGVSIFGSGVSGNVVSGNHIGVSASGVGILSNGEDGVWIGDYASGNTIGGDTSGERNVISANGWNGVSIEGSSATLNIVSGNYIGLASDGVQARGNGYNGVAIDNAPSNTIGGDAYGEGNMISGNTLNGVSIEGSSASGNIVSGNFIGVNTAGNSALPNQDSGVWIGDSASGNTIGGDALDERNVISGNGLHGVALGGGTSQTTISINYIGVTAGGSAALANGGSGVVILNSANNTVGGNTAGKGNVISGNSVHGVLISGSSASGNSVMANMIGLDSTGTTSIPNLQNGVALAAGAHDNTIGGDDAGERNFIAGNSQNGVKIDGSSTTGNVVSGNYIGLQAAGSNTRPNILNGVLISGGANGNTIGGDSAGERNVISGNKGSGVRIEGSGTSSNIVSANYIGLNAAGTAAAENLNYGVSIGDSASSNTVGGDTPGERNVISGNHLWGMLIEGGARLNVISGNYIGSNPAGSAALPNGGEGIKIDNSPQNVIGGDVAGERNVISGNSSNGIWISGSAATGNVVTGNYIGLAAGGLIVLPNGGNGIVINGGAVSNTIGGATYAEANYISGNGSAGVLIAGSDTDQNVVKRNTIGLDGKGTDAAGNGSHGVLISGAAAFNTIGPGNVIAFNAGDGVEVNGGTTANNRITQNSIFSNAMGIDLVDGANAGIAAPVIQSVLPGIGVVQINGITCASCLVEVFGNPDVDGEGRTYLGSATANAGGAFRVEVSSLGGAAALTATAFNSHAGTSEFSGPFFVSGKNLFLPLVQMGEDKPKEGAQAESGAPTVMGGGELSLWISKEDRA